MSRFSLLVSCVAVTLIGFAALPANATTIYVDFGPTTQMTGTYLGTFYNDIAIASDIGTGLTTKTWTALASQLNNGTATTSPQPLTSTTSTATAWTISFQDEWNYTTGNVNTPTAAYYTGPYPSAVSGIAQTALEDSVYVGLGAGLLVTMSGLNDSNTYNLLAYGGRLNSSSTPQPWTLVTGSSPSATTQSFACLSNSTAVVQWNTVQSVGGVIAFNMVDIDGTGGPTGSITAMGFLSVQEVPAPEPSTFALAACGLLGLLAYAWRRRK